MQGNKSRPLPVIIVLHKENKILLLEKEGINWPKSTNHFSAERNIVESKCYISKGFV